MKGVFRFILFLTLLTLLNSQLFASKLNVNIMPVSLNLRSNAPFPVLLQIFSDEKGPVTGKLEIKCFISNSNYTITTNELVILPGSQSRSMIFPALNFGNHYDRSLTLNMRFITKSYNYSIPNQLLSFTEKGGVTLNILNGVESFGRAKRFNIAKELKFEKLVKTVEFSKTVANTTITNLQLEKFPRSVEGYCAYDLVRLNEDVFVNMSERELDILKNWVLSGGGLFINLKSEELELIHLNFINDLIKAEGGKRKLLSRDDLGKLSQKMKDDCATYQPGFGRFSLLRKIIKSDDYFKTSEWRLMLAFMWRINFNRIKSVVDDYQWEGKGFSENENQSMYEVEYESRYDYRRNTYYSINDILNNNCSLLLPANSTMIPIWLLLLILVSFIIIVGPLDYIVLGKLKLRRFTWILFPIVSTVYAILIVVTANRYMGSNDHSSTLSIEDEGDDGRVYRKTEYVVDFTGSSKKVIHPCKRLFFSNQTQYDRSRGYIGGTVMEYSGSLFSNYNVSLETKQWVPRISRINSFQITKSSHKEWSFPDDWNNNSQKEFLSQTFTNSGKDVEIAMLRSGKPLLLRESQNRQFNNLLLQLRSYMNGANSQVYYIRYSMLFLYIHELSPSSNYGSVNLMIGDRTNKSSKVIIVSVYDSNRRGIKIYRREYR